MVNSMFRISVALGLAGMGLGIYMGIQQDFTLAPAHAHLNLVGFVTLFLSALYYRAVPEAAAGLVARLHVAIATAGAVVFPISIACELLGDHARVMPFVAAAAVIVFVGMALFAFIVIRTSGTGPLPTTRPGQPTRHAAAGSEGTTE